MECSLCLPCTRISPLRGEPLTGEPDAGNPPVRFGGGAKPIASPYPYLGELRNFLLAASVKLHGASPWHQGELRNFLGSRERETPRGKPVAHQGELRNFLGSRERETPRG